MTSDLQALRITHAELDQLTGLDIDSVFMGRMIRPSVWKSRRQLVSLLITECLVLGTVFVVCLGLGLVLVSQRQGFDQFGALLLGIAGAIALGAVLWHLYQGQRAKTFITLARLLDECDRHNDIIQALQVMAELEQAQGAPGLQNSEILVALQTTRDSLTAALMTEKILRRHRALMQRQQDLFSTLETNLATLQALHVNHQASQYRQFLQEALNIGLAVQREMNINQQEGPE
ncbi:hypothetical protein PGN35_016380 [Nodosilinea sp. PGN35]|uniref:hypothetical protein n=1 Tax=Nodosilinea sp. PGN35 TaxID=3020489 RepID=UPI0023B22124|nr:hypothetical protein [Nodosilinea sp. TSF1-S3]MDF0366215.1 hypothetical protein [Nodosilinea sp. TSF1-S3]